MIFFRDRGRSRGRSRGRGGGRGRGGDGGGGGGGDGVVGHGGLVIEIDGDGNMVDRRQVGPRFLSFEF